MVLKWGSLILVVCLAISIQFTVARRGRGRDRGRHNNRWRFEYSSEERETGRQVWIATTATSVPQRQIGRIIWKFEGGRWVQTNSKPAKPVERSNHIQHLTKSCGRPHSRTAVHRVVGGKMATPHEWPWSASVQSSNGFGQFIHQCGAALISGQWLITAAHCLANRQFSRNRYRVVLGAPNLGNLQGSYKTRTILKTYLHPDYRFNDNAMEYDIALIKMNRPVPLNDQIQPICVTGHSAAEPKVGEECVVAGWGASNFVLRNSNLREVRVPIMNRQKCSRIWSPPPITNNFICAFKEGRDSCDGDSGGSLMCKHEGRWYTTGIVSWGTLDCGSMPGVYTRVKKMYNWIERTVRNTQ